MIDNCIDGNGIQARFFDADQNLVWPSDHGKVFPTTVDGAEVRETLACIFGDKLCYGAAKNPEDNTYWGLSLEGDESCANCCVLCGGLGKTFTLNCN